MTYTNEKINYTNYCKLNLTEETDTIKIKSMFESLKSKMQEIGLKGKVSAKYYTNGRIKVELNGIYYNIFDAIEGEFYSGCVGDYKKK